MEIKQKLEELDRRMYTLNANLSALIHIQKIKSKEEAERFLIKINQEIASWIGEVRNLKESGSQGTSEPQNSGSKQGSEPHRSKE